MKQTIAIFAYKQHFDVLGNLVKILSHASITLHLFIDKQILRLLNLDSSQRDLYFHLISPENAGEIIRDKNEILVQCHLVLAITLPRELKAYDKLAANNPFSFIVHNGNFCFDQLEARDASIQSKLYRLRAKVLGNASRRKNLIGLSKNIFFLSKNVQFYMSERHPQMAEKFKFLPYRFSNGNAQTSSSYFEIVFSGGVNSDNRDYRPFFDWAATKENLQSVRIVFLGKSKASERMLFDGIKSRGATIIFYEKYLVQSDYDAALKNAHVLIAALRPEILFQGYREYYGKSKITGAISDAIKFQKPILIPAFYGVDPKTEHLVQPYSDSNEFIQKLDRFYMGEHVQPTIAPNEMQGPASELLNALLEKKNSK